MSVGGFETDEILMMEILDLGGCLATNLGKRCRCLGRNYRPQRMPKFPTESMAFAVEVKGDAVQCSHRGHLSARMRPNTYSSKDEIQL